MAKAKTLNPAQYQRVRDFVVNHSTNVERDLVALSLSFRAGLRAIECARISWDDVVTADNRITEPNQVFEIPNTIAKKKAGHVMVMHRDLYLDLVALRQKLLEKEANGCPKRSGAILTNHTGTPYKPHALVMHLSRLYAACGFVGVSSHSGRRTFLTSLSRRVNDHGCSIFDLQALAGHSSVQTTAEYIDNSDRMGSLVNSL